jgi:hypothetical protein
VRDFNSAYVAVGIGYRYVSSHQLRTCRPQKLTTTSRERMQQHACRTQAYSITSSAVASRVGGTVRPSILAVW